VGDTYTRIKHDHIVVVDMNEPFIKVACCDCGLVHCWTFGLVTRDDKLYLEINIDRLERCTAAKRREGNCDLIEPKEGLWEMTRK
jgi:hypothetical protein